MGDNLQKKYKAWRSRLIFGIFLWPFAAVYLWFWNAVGLDHSPDVSSEEADFRILLFALAIGLAVLIAMTCLKWAEHLFKNARVASAIKILRVPFFYLLLFIALVFGTDIL